MPTRLPVTPIKCHECGATFGALVDINPDDVRAQLAGTMFAGLAGMLPPNMAEIIVPVLKHECGACLLRRIENAKQEENGREENGEAVHREADEEGNERTVRRGFLGRGRGGKPRGNAR